MKKFSLYLMLIFLISFNTSFSSSMANYCQIPPFLNSAVSPNVLLVVDKSGSMSWSAYYKTWSNSNNAANIGQYNSAITYEGYFVPDKVYEYKNGAWKESTKSENCNLTLNSSYIWWYGQYYNYYSVSGICSGNKLNFALMTRIDLLRWALTGGRPSGCSSFTDKNCDPDLACTGNTCTLEMYSGDKVVVPKSRIRGVLQEFEKEKNRPRFGVLFYDSSIYKDKVYIGDYPNGGNADPNYPYTYVKRAINYVSPGGGTGTAPAMWEAYDYFRQSNDHNYNNGFTVDPGTAADPNYFCDYKGQNCKPVPCAKNFVILASDGQWNVGGSSLNWTCTIKTGYENYSADPVVPAYWMHKLLNRTLTSLGGNSFSINVEAIYSLGLFLGGTGEQSLKNVAVYGSFDISQYAWPYGTDNTVHWNGNGGQYPWDTCEMDDCGSGRGSACTPLPPSSPDWDSNGDGVPDNFLSAKNAVEIKNSLLKFLRNILQRTASGTSVSVLSEKDSKGALVTQAVFYPQKNFGNYKVNWIGQLFTYWFLNTKDAQNIREDTNQDKKLSIKDDNILEFALDSYGNLKIHRFSSNTNGTKGTEIFPEYSSLDEVKYLWEAGEQLKNRQASDRVIYTVDNSNSLIEFTVSNLANFQSFLGTDVSEFPACLINGNTINYTNLVNYIRGQDIPGCRSRKVNSSGDVWKLADIIYSSPKIAYYKDQNGKLIHGVIFTASNDGMLHAFEAGKVESLTGSYVAKLTGTNLGKELWAFIPKHALPYLRYLADPNYCHLYIHDLAPYLINVDYDNDGTQEIVLIGGLRLGGGCSCSGTNCVNPPPDTCKNNTSCVGLSEYYALDVTDINNPKLLWEFTNPNLGFTYSGPAYIKRKDSAGNWKYFVLFASGPTSYDGYTSQNLHIFVLDLTTGNLLLDKDLGQNFSNSFGGRLFNNGLDVNEDGQTDYVFLGYSRKVGNATAKGGVLKIWTGDTNPNNWDFDETLLSFANNPVVAPIVAGKCFNKWFLYFGTGRYFYKTDDDQSQNALYGVPFLCDENNNCPTGTINPVHAATQNLACQNIADKTQGAWMIDLDLGNTIYLKERNISDPSISNNIVFFTTTQPTADLCGFGGQTRAWALNCATGDPAFSQRCPGFTVSNTILMYLVQLSGGNIEQFRASSFTESGGRATKFKKGVASEQGGIPVLPGGGLKGEILLWIER